MKLGQSLDERLSLALMPYFKQVEKTGSCSLRTRPPLETFSVSLVSEFDLFQSSQSTSDIWSKIAVIAPHSYNNFTGGDAQHGKPPSCLLLSVCYTKLDFRESRCLATHKITGSATVAARAMISRMLRIFRHMSFCERLGMVPKLLCPARDYSLLLLLQLADKRLKFLRQRLGERRLIHGLEAASDLGCKLRKGLRAVEGAVGACFIVG
jgi:hypothetical protein